MTDDINDGSLRVLLVIHAGQAGFLFFLIFDLSTQGMLRWLKVDDLHTHKDGRSLSYWE